MSIDRSASQEAIVSTAFNPFYRHGSQIIPATRGVQLGLVRHRRVRRLFAAFVIIAMTVLLSPCANAQSDAGNASPAPTTAVTLPPVSVIGTSPLIGSGIDRDTVPAETHVLTSKDLSRDGVPNAVGALNQQLGGVTLDSASGNPFQPTFFYHGFQASPLQGTPQVWRST